MTSVDDVTTFGQLVRNRRQANRWTQEALAAEALNNLDRKGTISMIERGKIPNITRETVKKVAEALSIDVEDIPASLRWPEATKVAKDTNTIVHEVQAVTLKLVDQLSQQAQEAKIKEGMLIALARRYAVGSPNDFQAAFRGVERALVVTLEDRNKSKLPANTDEALNAVISHVDALNEAGRLETATAFLAEEKTRAQAGLIRIYDKGIAQAVLTRDVDAAVAYEFEKQSLEAPESEEAFSYLRNVFIDWYIRGNQKGLNFDAEVAIAMMRTMLHRFELDQPLLSCRSARLGQ